MACPEHRCAVAAITPALEGWLMLLMTYVYLVQCDCLFGSVWQQPDRGHYNVMLPGVAKRIVGGRDF